jgi:hypothetical protein
MVWPALAPPCGARAAAGVCTRVPAVGRGRARGAARGARVCVCVWLARRATPRTHTAGWPAARCPRPPRCRDSRAPPHTRALQRRCSSRRTHTRVCAAVDARPLARSTRTRTRARAHAHAHTRTRTRARAHAHAHTRTHTHTHTHTHLCAANHVVLLSEDVHELALALVAPLRAQHDAHLRRERLLLLARAGAARGGCWRGRRAARQAAGPPAVLRGAAEGCRAVPGQLLGLLQQACAARGPVLHAGAQHASGAGAAAALLGNLRRLARASRGTTPSGAVWWHHKCVANARSAPGCVQVGRRAGQSCDLILFA